MESWSRGTAGLDSAGKVLVLPGATFMETNVEVRVAGVTIFWVQRNMNGMRRATCPASTIRGASSSTACAGYSPTRVRGSASSHTEVCARHGTALKGSVGRAHASAWERRVDLSSLPGYT